MPRGAGAMPSNLNSPNCLLSRANSRSPCSTLTSTCVWPSAAVEKIWLFLVGMVVLRSITFVMTPPMVSTPRDRGVTSSNNKPSTSPPSTPACNAAPMATHSSGLMPLNGSLPVSYTHLKMFRKCICNHWSFVSNTFHESESIIHGFLNGQMNKETGDCHEKDLCVMIFYQRRL